MEFKNYRANATACHFKSLSKVVYIITSINFWFEDDHLPHIFVKIYKSVAKFLEATTLAFVITALFARYTQDKLTDKQTTDVLFNNVCAVGVCFMYGFCSYHKRTMIELLFSLTVKLKGLYNNETLQRKMIKKSWIYLAGHIIVGFVWMTSAVVDREVHAMTSNTSFTPIIPIWPNIDDHSVFADFARIFVYFFWALIFVRSIAIYSIINCTSICLGYQFANLNEYFLSLNDIFDGEGRQEDKEIKYEKAVKVGIKMHNITLNCVHQLQSSCSAAYTVQVVVNVCGILLLLIQMMQMERTLGTLAPIIIMVAGILLFSGFFTWNAADITFEAERLPTAMFHSGWHNCTRQSSVRVRKMITIAMTQAQQVVVIKALGVIELSYASYITIVKSSYSVFSVIY